MEIPSLRREIHDQDKDLTCITRSRNWHKQRHSKFIDYLREYDIPLPFHPEASPDPESQHQTSAILLIKFKETKHAVLLDLNLNCDRAPR
jgi:hypothetical protein